MVTPMIIRKIPRYAPSCTMDSGYTMRWMAAKKTSASEMNMTPPVMMEVTVSNLPIP